VRRNTIDLHDFAKETNALNQTFELRAGARSVERLWPAVCCRAGV
jgi:hypothetical protein